MVPVFMLVRGYLLTHTGGSRETPEGPEGKRGMQEALGGPEVKHAGGSERAAGPQGTGTQQYRLFFTAQHFKYNSYSYGNFFFCAFCCVVVLRYISPPLSRPYPGGRCI